jgi:hypothetical protein
MFWSRLVGYFRGRPSPAKYFFDATYHHEAFSPSFEAIANQRN